jgi:CheY-like chemotaxis protein
METNQTPKRVLVVEASELILTWVVPVIEKLGCLVTTAADLTSAQTVIQGSEPLDLILLGDISQPTDIGPQTPAAEMAVLQQVRHSTKYKRTPVVVFTNLDWIDQARQAGASNWIVKPCGIDSLEEVVLPYLTAPTEAIRKKRQNNS